jgi:hypothetical protein
MVRKSKDPTKAYIILIPKSKIPVDIAPREKYFTVASIDTTPFEIKADKTYRVKLKPSIER